MATARPPSDPVTAWDADARRCPLLISALCNDAPGQATATVGPLDARTGVSEPFSVSSRNDQSWLATRKFNTLAVWVTPEPGGPPSAIPGSSTEYVGRKI